MGISAALFSWLHRSKFYSEFHEEAVQLLPKGHGEIWLDFGCGPGVLTRAAWRSGYRAVGLDSSSEMLAKAQEFTAISPLSSPATTVIEFRKFDIFAEANTNTPANEVMNIKGHVVSASSFLPVFTNKEAILMRLESFVENGGTLLLIETNENCTFWKSFELYKKDSSLSELGVLLLGLVRRGKSKSIAAIENHFKGKLITRHKLSNGMVDAFIVRKELENNHFNTYFI